MWIFDVDLGCPAIVIICKWRTHSIYLRHIFFHSFIHSRVNNCSQCAVKYLHIASFFMILNMQKRIYIKLQTDSCVNSKINKKEMCRLNQPMPQKSLRWRSEYQGWLRRIENHAPMPFSHTWNMWEKKMRANWRPDRLGVTNIYLFF